MPAREGDQPGTMRLSLAGSLGLHAVLAVALALLASRPIPHRAPPAVAIEIVSEKAFAALTETAPPGGGAAATVLPQQPPAPPTTPERAATPGMIRAGRLLAGEALANPASAQARAALPRLGAEERMEQLCNLEAMEQVHAWREALSPDRLVAYALEDSRIAGHRVEVDGGAIRIDHRWYEFRYRCDLTPAHDIVLAFEFGLGAAIPRKDWEVLALPADH